MIALWRVQQRLGFGWASVCGLAVILCAVECSADVHLTVGTQSQGGQYATVQAAVDAVPVSNTERYVIDIMPGTYVARVKIPSNKPLITLRGQNPHTTILTYNETTSTLPNESTGHASTVVQGADFIAENLTFANSYGPGTQALAIYAKADRLIFNNCRFTGWQDTLRSEFGRHYFHNVYVEGAVDFIYGKGTAYFESSVLYPKASGYITAQGRETAAETNGYVFESSMITGSAANNSVYLGRPWQAYSRAVFLNTKMGPAVRPEGWSTWPGNNNHLTAYFAEYNSMDLAGKPLNVSQRVNWSHQLTAVEADAFSKSAWLGGSDGWNPVAVDLVGDFNADGVVDAADYVVWRDHLGTSTLLANESASLGVVDQADYDEWRSNLGAVFVSAVSGAATGQVANLAAVPEPSICGLAVWSLFAAMHRMSTTKRTTSPRRRFLR